jgi:hypothetical protein
MAHNARAGPPRGTGDRDYHDALSRQVSSLEECQSLDRDSVTDALRLLTPAPRPNRPSFLSAIEAEY